MVASVCALAASIIPAAGRARNSTASSRCRAPTSTPYFPRSTSSREWFTERARAAALSKAGPSGRASAVAMTRPRGEQERLKVVSEVMCPWRWPAALKSLWALRAISEAYPRDPVS